jgi:cytochrome c553
MSRAAHETDDSGCRSLHFPRLAAARPAFSANKAETMSFSARLAACGYCHETSNHYTYQYPVGRLLEAGPLLFFSALITA